MDHTINYTCFHTCGVTGIGCRVAGGLWICHSHADTHHTSWHNPQFQQSCSYPSTIYYTLSQPSCHAQSVLLYINHSDNFDSYHLWFSINMHWWAYIPVAVEWEDLWILSLSRLLSWYIISMQALAAPVVGSTAGFLSPFLWYSCPFSILKFSLHFWRQIRLP